MSVCWLLLLNTCNFYRTFRFIFSFIVAENAQTHFKTPPLLPSVLSPSALDLVYIVGWTLNCLRRACVQVYK